MAKVKLALKAFEEVLAALPDQIAKVREASSLDPTAIEIEMSLAIDRDGGLDVGGEASGNVLEVAGAGVPVSVKAGFGSKWDNQGGMRVRLTFG